MDIRGPVFEHLLSVLFGKYLEVELLGRVVTLCYFFEEPLYHFPHFGGIVQLMWQVNGRDFWPIWAEVLPRRLSPLSGPQSCPGGRNHRREGLGP